MRLLHYSGNSYTYRAQQDTQTKLSYASGSSGVQKPHPSPALSTSQTMKVQTMLSRALPAVVLLTSASLGLAAESAGHSVAQVTPLQKVVTLLDGMLAKGKKEKHEEEVEFAKFQAW